MRLAARITSVTGLAELNSWVISIGSAFVPMPPTEIMRNPPSSSEKDSSEKE
jgi:hypothetical protein